MLNPRKGLLLKSREGLGCPEGRSRLICTDQSQVEFKDSCLIPKHCTVFATIKFWKSRTEKSGLWEEEILLLLPAATARLWAQMEGWCGQDCPKRLADVVTWPANKISQGGFATPLPAPDWFLAQITKHGQWQAGHPWDSYLESRAHPFWEKMFEKKGESSMKTHTGISSALPFQQFPFGSIFFLLLLFFSLRCLPNARHHLAFMKVKQKVSSY